MSGFKNEFEQLFWKNAFLSAKTGKVIPLHLWNLYFAVKNTPEYEQTNQGQDFSF